ncbi:MAG: cobalamin-dependent protein, partial [Acidaminococcaceae bacterium]|nr:cobalamin-dependent protein [Acidaminococcaceae bacterium]
MEKKDILLIHVPQCYWAEQEKIEFHVGIMPMGFYSMASQLAKAGFQPEILHLAVEVFLGDKIPIAKYVRETGCKMVGLSLHWYQQSFDTLMVAELIKKSNPDVFVFLGGYTASAYSEEILEKYPFVDGIIKGEGEVPCNSLAKQIIKNNSHDLSQVSNLYWRNEQGQIVKNEKTWVANTEELNSFDFAEGVKYLKHSDTCLKVPIVLEFNKDKAYLDKVKTFVVCSNRGCVGNCAWCGGGLRASEIVTGRKCVTIREPQIVADEILRFHTDEQITRFYFGNDPLPMTQENIIVIMDILGKQAMGKIKIGYECFALPTEKFLQSFKKNLHQDSQVILSPDYASQEKRRECKTFTYTNEELLKSIAKMAEMGIKSQVYFGIMPDDD